MAIGFASSFALKSIVFIETVHESVVVFTLEPVGDVSDVGLVASETVHPTGVRGGVVLLLSESDELDVVVVVSFTG